MDSNRAAAPAPGPHSQQPCTLSELDFGGTKTIIGKSTFIYISDDVCDDFDDDYYHYDDDDGDDDDDDDCMMVMIL